MKGVPFLKEKEGRERGRKRETEDCANCITGESRKKKKEKSVYTAAQKVHKKTPLHGNGACLPVTSGSGFLNKESKKPASVW